GDAGDPLPGHLAGGLHCQPGHRLLAHQGPHVCWGVDRCAVPLQVRHTHPQHHTPAQHAPTNTHTATHTQVHAHIYTLHTQTHTRRLIDTHRHRHILKKRHTDIGTHIHS